MVILIWGGAAVSIVGLIGLLFSMFKVASAKKNTTSDEDLRISIQAAMPLNLASLFLSVLSHCFTRLLSVSANKGGIVSRITEKILETRISK